MKKWAVVLFQKDTLSVRLDALGIDFDIKILGYANDGFFNNVNEFSITKATDFLSTYRYLYGLFI